MMFHLKNPELKHLLICWSKVLIIFQLLQHQIEDENFVYSLLLINDQKAVDHNIHHVPPTVENNVTINWNHQLIISKLILWDWLMNIDHILSTALLLLLKYLYTEWEKRNKYWRLVQTDNQTNKLIIKLIIKLIFKLPIKLIIKLIKQQL